MLRILSQAETARLELRRIGGRTSGEELRTVEEKVGEIARAVRLRGDEALAEFTAKFDGLELSPERFRVGGSELDAAYQKTTKELIDAIQLACRRIEAFHRQRLPQSWVQFETDGVVLGKQYRPVDRAGIYIPGGRASYPSTVLMSAIPARVAGVPRIIMVTPPSGPEGQVSPAVLVAAQEAGVEEIYRVGGAQAIAALAFGTETIPAVDVIAGPGNIYVTLAKKMVYGKVGIDSLAGPSEVLVIADRGADPEHVAADLLAQAEHDPMAAAILLTPEAALAEAVQQAVSEQLKNHPRRLLAEKSLANYGLIVVVESLAAAVELSNEFAPEHLELEVAEPWDLLGDIRHAGAIFLGYSTPEAVGDYLAGPNHTLPTAGAARYASALGVETFVKHSSLIEYSRTALGKVADAIDTLAVAEGLHSHAESVRLRQKESDANDR